MAMTFIKNEKRVLNGITLFTGEPHTSSLTPGGGN